MKLNQRALDALLHSEDGPVGREVTRRAEEIVGAARANARRILHRLPEDTFAAVAAAIDFEQHGVEATVGIRPEGSLSEYLAAKEGREGAILRRALQDVFNGAH